MFHALHKIQWNKQWNKQTYNQKNSQRKFEKPTNKQIKKAMRNLKILKKEKNRAATAESSLLVCYQNQSAAARGFSEIGESRSKNPYSRFYYFCTNCTYYRCQQCHHCPISRMLINGRSGIDWIGGGKDLKQKQYESARGSFPAKQSSCKTQLNINLF